MAMAPPCMRLFLGDGLDQDSDDDGLLDGEEVNSFNTDPTLFDSDSDGLSIF